MTMLLSALWQSLASSQLPITIEILLPSPACLSATASWGLLMWHSKVHHTSFALMGHQPVDAGEANGRYMHIKVC